MKMTDEEIALRAQLIVNIQIAVVRVEAAQRILQEAIELNPSSEEDISECLEALEFAHDILKKTEEKSWSTN